MKTTLHYIIAILLFSLNATHAFAEGEEGPFNITKDNSITYAYNADQTLLTIDGGGSITITGDGTPVECGIVVKHNAIVNLTIKDLYIRAKAPLEVLRDPIGNLFELTLEGTNKLESTKEIVAINSYTSIQGSGSLTVQGVNGVPAIDISSSVLYLEGNPILVAIGGKDAEAICGRSNLTHNGGLLIQGHVTDDGGTIEQTFSELKGNLTLGTDFEIPSWAEVTIPAGQSITVPTDKTLTNKGTLETEEGGSLTNNGSIVNEGELTNNGSLVNDGTFTNEGTPVTGNQPQHLIIFKANDSGSTTDVESYITEGETLPTDIFTRSGYTFQGWFTDPDGGTKVETVTGAQTLYAQWEADEPAVEPDPTPIYYNVYLPQVEGATTDPGPGKHEVESWDNFRFYLTIDSAYSDSQPVVTTDRGETLVPRSSDGAYLVKYVRTDVEVFIDGLIQNPPPVANEAIGTDALVPQIWAEGSMLCVRMAEALPSAPVSIFTVGGRLYDSFASTPGLKRRQLLTGVYIIRIGETACKVLIR